MSLFRGAAVLLVVLNFGGLLVAGYPTHISCPIASRYCNVFSVGFPSLLQEIAGQNLSADEICSAMTTVDQCLDSFTDQCGSELEFSRGESAIGLVGLRQHLDKVVALCRVYREQLDVNNNEDYSA